MNLALFLPDSTKQFMQAKTDAYGNFLLDGLAFEDSASISFKSTIKRFYQEELHVTFTQQNPTLKYAQPLPEINYVLVADTIKVYSETILKDIENLKNERSSRPVVSTLKEVVIKSNAKSPKQLLDEKLSSGRFYSQNETIYDFVNEKTTRHRRKQSFFLVNGKGARRPQANKLFFR